MVRASLYAHRQTQHGAEKGGPGQEGKGEDWGENPREYRMAFLTKAVPISCPVEGCSGREATQTAMRMNFWKRNVRDTVVILEEGNLPHPQCPLCDMMVPWR